MKELTARQREVYDFIRKRIETGVPPTIRDICEGCDIASFNGARTHLEVLQAKGWITVVPFKSRSIRLTAEAKAKEESMARILTTVVQDERGVEVRAYPSTPDDDSGAPRFFVCFGVNGVTPAGENGSMAIHGFTEEALERFVADVYNAARDAIHASKQRNLRECEAVMGT